MVTQSSQVATARKTGDSYLLRFIAVVSGGYETDFNLNNIIAMHSASSISSAKHSPANAIKISAAI